MRMLSNLLKKLVIVKALLALLVSATAFADTYIKPLPSMPITFDPKLYADAYSIYVSSQIYDRLFEFDELQNIKPSVADKWESAEGGKIWIIHLKKNVLFHDGRPLTADDVEFSLLRLLQHDSVKNRELSIIAGAENFIRGRSKTVPGIKVVSPDEIRIELTSPFPPFLNILASVNTEILPKNLNGQSESSFFRHPIGTGAFKFESAGNDRVVLVANLNYFRGRPFLDRIVFELSDSNNAVAGFNRGYYHDLEWYYEVDPNKITTAYTVIKALIPDVSVLAFNVRRQPFNNVHFRKAVLSALDRNKLVAECFPNKKVTTGYMPPGVGGHDPNVKPPAFSVSNARKELQLSGIPNSILSKQITIYRPSNHMCVSGFRTFIEKSFREIGLNATVKYVTLAELFKSYYSPRNFDMFNMIFSSDYPEALFLLNYFRSDHPDNYSGFKSKAFDELLTQASKSEDRYERYNLYRKAQEILNQEAVVVPLFYNTYEGIYQRNVRGVEMPPYVTYYVPMKSIYFEKDSKSK